MMHILSRKLDFCNTERPVNDGKEVRRMRRGGMYWNTMEFEMAWSLQNKSGFTWTKYQVTSKGSIESTDSQCLNVKMSLGRGISG